MLILIAIISALSLIVSSLSLLSILIVLGNSKPPQPPTRWKIGG